MCFCKLIKVNLLVSEIYIYFSLFHIVQLLLDPNQHPIQWLPTVFLAVKLPGRAVDHSHLSSAEANIACSCSSTTHLF